MEYFETVRAVLAVRGCLRAFVWWEGWLLATITVGAQAILP